MNNNSNSENLKSLKWTSVSLKVLGHWFGGDFNHVSNSDQVGKCMTSSVLGQQVGCPFVCQLASFVVETQLAALFLFIIIIIFA